MQVPVGGVTNHPVSSACVDGRPMSSMCHVRVEAERRLDVAMRTPTLALSENGFDRVLAAIVRARAEYRFVDDLLAAEDCNEAGLLAEVRREIDLRRRIENFKRLPSAGSDKTSRGKVSCRRRTGDASRAHQ